VRRRAGEDRAAVRDAAVAAAAKKRRPRLTSGISSSRGVL